MKRTMKGVLFAGLTAIALAGSGIAAMAADSGPPVEGAVQNFDALDDPVAVPDVAVLTQDGGTTTLDRFRGRFVVLNFWATWCGPCVRELPSLEELAAAYPPERAQVVLVSQDRGGFRQTEKFLKKLGVSFPENFIDERLKFSRAMGVRSLPTTVLIAPDGREVGRLVGHAEWDSEEAKALIDWYLERSENAGTSG